MAGPLSEMPSILILPLHFLQAPGLQCYLAQAIGSLKLLHSNNVFKVPNLTVGENRDSGTRLTDPKLLGICSITLPSLQAGVSRIPARRGLY